ncbi:MAG: ABC transporter ATP-binding protein [Bacilli bacterium]|jgi:ABC-2 type transport system ATP-binding protein|nr:ABC transporter ATP-binding protein [Bacilli bacterium]
MIEINNISKKYSGSSDYVIKDMNLKIDSGKIIGFIGHNGAGKSTTLNMISGILEPTDGDILINGYSIINDALNAKMQFAYVMDSPDNFLKLTGYEYLNFIGNVYQIPADEINNRIKILADEYLMSDKLNQLIDSYSHGMRQKINVMGALLHEPSVFLLDEPLNGLDPQASKILKDSMKEHVKKGNTVLFSTHILEVAEKLCDEIIIINKGKIIYQGSLDDLQAQYEEGTSLEDIFLSITSKNVE